MVTVKVKVPTTVGTPLMTPVLAFNVNPSGKLPAVTSYVTEPVVGPLAMRVSV